VRLVCPRPRHATLVPDAIITHIAGATPKSSPVPASLTLSSSPTFEPDPVPSAEISLDSVPSVSFHSAEPLSAETLSIPIKISSPPAIASIPSPRSSPDTALVTAAPALDEGAHPALNMPVAEQSTAKPASKIDQWWLDHRKGVVSGVKTVLMLASKVLEDVPAGGATAAKILDFGVKALENVQVILARQEGLRLADSLRCSNPGRMCKPSAIWSRS
jgi:hypothetical protein